MKEFNILIAGVGGQGVMLAARILAEAFRQEGHKVIIGETFGASQREGSVMSNIRVGSEVYGPLISPGEGDLLLGFEPVEALRRAGYLSSRGVAIINLDPWIPPKEMVDGKYPDSIDILSLLEHFTTNIYVIKATKLAKEISSKYSENIDSTNMVMLGAVSTLKDFSIDSATLKEALLAHIPKRAVKINLEAFEGGRNALVRASWERSLKLKRR